MSAHALKTTNQDDPLHRLFETAEFLQFRENPYLNAHIHAVRSALGLYVDPINLDMIETSIPRVFTSDKQRPARNIFELEIDRIKNPDKSVPSIASHR